MRTGMLSLLFAGAISGAGCATPGLRFEILQPPVLLGGTQSVVQSTGATITTQPSGNFVTPFATPNTTMTMIPTTSITSVAPAPRVDFSASVSSCTLDDLCRRVQALETPRIQIKPNAERLPMPAPKAAIPMPPAPCE